MSNKSTRTRNTMDGKRYLRTLRESIFFILNAAPRVQNLNLNFWKLKLQILLILRDRWTSLIIHI